MPNFLKLHSTRLFVLLMIANGLLLLYVSTGQWKPFNQWAWADIVGEGGSGILTLIWLCLILNSRPAGRITTMLAIGLGLMFLAWWVDTLDEVILLPKHIQWDHWLESVPMSLGMLLLTYGLYHWHHEQLAISAQRRKQERLFRDHRYFDQLTPLSGATYLRQHIDLALQDDAPETTCLIAIDLDDFDSINQRFGHREGDQVLQAVSQLLLLNLRNQDLICRLAGDRFVALLPHTSEIQARTMADELRDCVSSFALRTQQHGQRLQLRATTAVIVAQKECPEKLLERLHQAIARAKPRPALKLRA